MLLADYLRTTGFTKASLSRALGIGRAAIQKWDEIPEKWESRLEGLKPDEPKLSEKAKNWDEYSIEEMKEIFKRRGGVEGDSLRILETDYEIACSLGFKVWEFNKMIESYILKMRKV